MQNVEKTNPMRKINLELLNSFKLKKIIALFLLMISFSLSAQLSFEGEATIDFAGFTASAGELASENFTAIDAGNLNLGFTSGGVNSGGVYSLQDAFILGNRSLWIQPSGSAFTPGSITLRIQNNTCATLTELDLAYDILYLNDQPRSNSLNFSYSEDNSTYTDVGALDFTTAVTADVSPTIMSVNKSTAITGISVAVGDYLYLRWTGDDELGSGSRDEYGLDNITMSVDPVHNTDTGENFATIQAAIDDAETLDGHTIVVCEGTYNESVLVNKSLTINGPNALNSPNTGSRDPEAVITNGVNDRAFTISNGNTDVKISGFKFDGGSPIHDGNDTNNPNTSDVTFSKKLCCKC